MPLRHIYFTLVTAAILAITCCVLFSCKKKNDEKKVTLGTSDDFSYRGLPEVGGLLDFRTTAIDTGTFLWTSGDGRTSTLYNPQYFYTDSGSFSVSLILNGDFAHAVTKTIRIAGLNYPYYYTGNPCKGDSIHMHFPMAIPTGTIFWWDFGDGSPISVDSAPSHVYSATGNYLVRLIVDSVDSRPYFKSIKIFTDPVYTHLMGGMRVWHRVEKVTYLLGTNSNTLADSSFAINIIDAVTVSMGKSKLVYNPDSSSAGVLVYDFGGDPSGASYSTFKLSYFYTTDSISLHYFITQNSFGIGHPPPTYYDDVWHTP